MSPPTQVEIAAGLRTGPGLLHLRRPPTGPGQDARAARRPAWRPTGTSASRCRTFDYPETPRSAYGRAEARGLRRRRLRDQRRRHHRPRGGAVLARAVALRLAVPAVDRRARSSTPCTARACARAARSRRMADDFIVAMLSTDCNRDGLEQVRPVLERAGYHIWVAHSPGPLHDFHPEIPGWMHADMWIAPLDRDLALIYPPWCDYETIRYLHVDRLHADRGAPRGAGARGPVQPDHDRAAEGADDRGRPEDPRPARGARASRSSRSSTTRCIKYGGAIRCTTMQLVRDPGPTVFS